MKAKKFLKIIKKVCVDNNCAVGKCPMAYARKGEKYSSCLMMAAESVPCDWDIDAIITAVKRYKLDDLLELEERKHGHWIEHPEHPIGDCSVCGERVPIYSGSKKYKICPNCGAKMDGESNE